MMSDQKACAMCGHYVIACENEHLIAQMRIDELEAQVRNQEAQITGHHKYVGQDYQFRLQKLERERDALKADAERYRWLAKNFGVEYDGPESFKLYTLVKTRKITNKAEFDAAIDAEREEK